ncbi:hypothetical protein ABDI30_03065 [Paenibacillus cisolokensis]|uniref:Galactose mutarotase n=1 Tax=Paenibacillus campinasensis TaxID=66347 RepID=A0ABW9SW93_9BACL|nr:hypothetical protein [Paenibacillus campinasensis]MUG65114.1 hypothetical protein [Paenibacillus campinasensis]
MTWSRATEQGFTVWRGGTTELEVAIVPELGNRVISLRNRQTGREWMVQPTGAFDQARYADSFERRDGSGWDDMFPTINPCRYPDFPWAGTELPDHGEVWALPWEASVSDGALSCHVHGVRLPYELTKTYTFPREDCLRMEYTVRNHSPFPLSFLWAAHPLFAIEEGMELIVPAGLDQIAVSYSAGGRLGKTGDIRPWPQPLPDQPELRLDVTAGPDDGTAEKYYFSGALTEGAVSLYHPRTKEGVRLSFPVEKVPYLAVWANYGGYRDQYHLALEPATGWLDDVAYAMARRAAAEAPGRGAYTWYLELCLE